MKLPPVTPTFLIAPTLQWARYWLRTHRIDPRLVTVLTGTVLDLAKAQGAHGVQVILLPGPYPDKESLRALLAELEQRDARIAYP